MNKDKLGTITLIFFWTVCVLFVIGGVVRIVTLPEKSELYQIKGAIIDLKCKKTHKGLDFLSFSLIEKSNSEVMQYHHYDGIDCKNYRSQGKEHRPG